MADNQENDLHFPRIYTLHSQKGGVGKTSIAIAIAGLAAIHYDKMTLIIDADFTGTSFLDIPDMIKVDKKEYFNDFMLAKPSEFEKYTPITSGKTNEKIKETRKKFCWNVPDGDGKIFCMPGSALVKDMKKIIPLISQEDHLRFFRHRLEDILVTATMAGFEVIIIDHSPGKAPGQLFDATIEIPEVFKKIKSLPDGRNVHSELIKYFDDRAKEVGAGAAEYINDFDMARILGIIKNLKTKQKLESAEWERWCRQVSKTVRLPVKVREEQLPVTNRS